MLVAGDLVSIELLHTCRMILALAALQTGGRCLDLFLAHALQFHLEHSSQENCPTTTRPHEADSAQACGCIHGSALPSLRTIIPQSTKSSPQPEMSVERQTGTHPPESQLIPYYDISRHIPLSNSIYDVTLY